ncbi:DUF1177 domain-containing protein [Parasutterella secunda]|uniref:DUF1177 domain-containing protein n=1 Tax=Parasutterella secunda TaxID=626947 RepID=A0ABS2GTP4_9BURK|nr:DUF1177 domain-containing protein [Parasutterella secunda]MBM6928851.1 DUF1177 domain-containing protein [Parasutterella secunda]
MTFKHLIELQDLLDDPTVDGERVATYLRANGALSVEVQTLSGEKGSTDFIRVLIPGSAGKTVGGPYPTLGIIGRLGGLGARPERLGFTSDGDGALAATACAAKLSQMRLRGDVLKGDVIVTTHICPHAPTRPHDPVPFMDSPVSSQECNSAEVDPAMDAILCIDTTKGNRIVNVNGFAITPTVKEGYILRTSEALLSLMEIATGRLPVVLPLTQQDITPYGNGVYHLNSILQPSVATSAPCVGVAITTQTQVPGCATGASHLNDIDDCVRFVIEVAKVYGPDQGLFYDEKEYDLLLKGYGSLKHFQTFGELL